MHSINDYKIYGGTLLRDGEKVEITHSDEPISKKNHSVDISVVIPHYGNDISFLQRSIRSVLKQRSNKFSLEIIIVDDASPIDVHTLTEDITEQHRAIIKRICLANNRGQAHACNIGTSLASGELITFLDADDEIIGEHSLLELQRELESHPNSSLASSNIIMDISKPNRGDESDWIFDLPNYTGKVNVSHSREGSLLKTRKARKYTLWELMEHDYDIGVRLTRKDSLIEAGGWYEKAGMEQTGYYLTRLFLETLGGSIPVDIDAHLYHIHGGNVSANPVNSKQEDALRSALIYFLKKSDISFHEFQKNASAYLKKIRPIEESDLF